MLIKWDISKINVHCVSRDAGANMKKALFLSGVNNLDSAVHKIQHVVKIGISSIGLLKFKLFLMNYLMLSQHR